MPLEKQTQLKQQEQQEQQEKEEQLLYNGKGGTTEVVSGFLVGELPSRPPMFPSRCFYLLLHAFVFARFRVFALVYNHDANDLFKS